MTRFKHLKVGVLALQGDYELHQRQIEALGASYCPVRLPSDLDNLDGLIIPGGESSTMNILIDRFGLRKPLEKFAASLPIYGTCAGMILLAKQVNENQAGIKPLAAIDIDVVRNGYGRQIFSFEDEITADLAGERIALRVSFIRAPMVTRSGKDVEILATYKDKPVLVRAGNVLAAAFHQELEGEAVLLQYFMSSFLCASTDSRSMLTG